MKQSSIIGYLMGLLMINPIMVMAVTTELPVKNDNIVPKIYKSEKLYDLYLEGLRQQKSPEYIESLFSKAYLSKHSNDKSYMDNKVIACKRYDLEDKFTQHRRSQLNYVVTSICNPYFPTVMHRVHLKKERNTGWMIDNITESAYIKKQDRPAYEVEHDYVFAEYATDTLFKNYLTSVRQGEPWNVYKKYHTDVFVVNSESNMKDLTKKQRQGVDKLNQMMLNCQIFRPLTQKTEGLTHTTVYESKDVCGSSDNDTSNYRQMIFKYNDNAWKIENMTIAVDNIF